MNIIFGRANKWQLPLMRFLKYFKFKVFYIHIESKSEFHKNEIATQLKKIYIIPLPIEFGKQISRKALSLHIEDSDEIAYRKNIQMVPDKILKKYCNLFSINETEIKTIRLLIQDIISAQQRVLSSRIAIWSNLHPSEKIIFISFKLKSFFTSDVSSNVTKIIIPIDVFSYLGKIIKKNFSLFFILKNKKQNVKNLDDKYIADLQEKNIAFVVHKGLSYGSKDYMLFNKSLYYSDDKNSPLNKYNILHLDYSNFSSPEKNINWVCLKKTKVNRVKIFFATLLACIKTFYLIRSWSTFLVWGYCIQQYNAYIKYCEVTKKFKNLKIAIIDYDCLCPKTLILAFKKSNIKTVATQERFVTTFYTSYANVLIDTYYTSSEYTANFVKNSKYYIIKNIIPVGQYRSDYISLYKNGAGPEEISKARNNGKKILIILGHISLDYWFESYIHPFLNWTAQLNFLEDCIRLSQNLENTYIILRYKNLDWTQNQYFEKVLDKIKKSENITISSNYKESSYSYKLCAKADLIIAKHTSLADECLVNEIPVLFYEYTHNIQKLVLDIPNYLSSKLICYNFDELYQKSKSILFSSSSKFGEELKKLNKTIYFVSKKQNIKKKILENLENQLVNNGL